MNIRQFECLRAIMTTGSLTQAAVSLGISQPSASSLIANLEHNLGFKLFKRVKRRLVATPEAQLLLPHVTQALESIDLAMHKADQIRNNRHGDLTIAAYPDIAIDFLPKVMSKLLADKPSIKATLLARRSEMMSGLLPTQEFDMAIVTQVTQTHNLNTEEIRLPCLVAFPLGEAPANSGVLGPADIRHKRLVTLMPSHPTAVQLAERFSQASIRYPGASIKTQTFESACSFIRGGVGVGILDVITASRYAGHSIETRAFEPTVWQNLFLLTPKDRPTSSILRLFIDELKLQLEELTRIGDSTDCAQKT